MNFITQTVEDQGEGPDLPIGLSLGPQDPRGTPEHCGTQCNCQYM